MANIKSQKKRILITKEENARNTALRTRCKNAVKKYEAAIAEGDVAKAKELLPDTVSIITKAGIYKDNTVSRKIARFSKMLYELEKASLRCFTSSKKLRLPQRKPLPPRKKLPKSVVLPKKPNNLTGQTR